MDPLTTLITAQQRQIRRGHHRPTPPRRDRTEETADARERTRRRGLVAILAGLIGR